MKIHLLVTMLASTALACGTTTDGTPPPTTTTPPTTVLPAEGSVRGVHVPLNPGSGQRCEIDVSNSHRVIAHYNDSIRWTADIDANATYCKDKFKILLDETYEINCTSPFDKISAVNPLEDCDHEADTSKGGKVRLICSLLLPAPTATPRCFKYTIKVHNDKVDPQIEIDPGAIMVRSSNVAQ